MPSTYMEFVQELEFSLPNSEGTDRKRWAEKIISEEIDLLQLAHLLKTDRNIALRFSWLLSDVGMQDKNYLKKTLPKLITLAPEITSFNFSHSFATYWNICGIPKENEGLAIEWLFDWINGSEVNVTTRSRAILALVGLTGKYPELKQELKTSLEAQKDRYTDSFRKRVEKIIADLS